MSDLREVGAIERDEDGEGVRYANVMLLAPGEWTDAGSRETIYYAPDAIQRSAENWVDNQVNLYHDPQNPTANVGYVDTDSVTVDDRGRLFGDLVLHGRTSASEDAIGLMDLALESEGQHGLGGPSVEIPQDVVEWDSDRGLQRMIEMQFSGIGLVMTPASQPVAFDEQTSDRAVALSQSVDGGIRMMVPDAGDDPADSDTDNGTGMSEPDDLQKRLTGVRTDLESAARALQNPTDMALNAVEQYLADEANSADDSVDELEAWASESLDEPIAAAVSEMVAAFREAGEGEAATVGGFSEWASGATEEPTEPEGAAEEMEESEEMQEGEGDADLEPAVAAEVVDTLEDVAATVEDVAATVDTQASSLDAAMSQVDDLNQRLESLEAENIGKRLEAVEEEGQPTTLAEGGGRSNSRSDSPDLEAPDDGGFVRDRGYISR